MRRALRINNAGKHYIVVWDPLGRTGDYGLYLGLDLPERISEPSIRRGQLTLPDQTQSYIFHGKKGECWSISAQRLSETLMPVLALSRAGKAKDPPEVTKGVPVAKLPVKPLPADDDYLLVVSSERDGAGEYELSVSKKSADSCGGLPSSPEWELPLFIGLLCPVFGVAGGAVLLLLSRLRPGGARKRNDVVWCLAIGGVAGLTIYLATYFPNLRALLGRLGLTTSPTDWSSLIVAAVAGFMVPILVLSFLKKGD